MRAPSEAGQLRNLLSDWRKLPWAGQTELLARIVALEQLWCQGEKTTIYCGEVA